MAFRDIIYRVRESVTDMTQRFLHGDNQGYEQPQGYGQQEAYYEQPAYHQEAAPPYAGYEAAYHQPQPGYQQPPAQQPPFPGYQQEAYPSQEGYQSPYAGSFARQTQPQAPQQQPQPAPRSPRSAAHMAENVVPFPGVMTDGAGGAFIHDAHILQLRDREECRVIIEHLKNNCSVAVNMDTIASDAEKQRCVDMLSGAAYTLNCNINRISTRGVYLITPQAVRVSSDEATRRLNGGAPRQAAQRPGRAHSYATRAPQGQEGYESQEAGYGEYGAEPAPQGYQAPYANEGEYRTAGYYGQEPRRAAGYGR